MTRISVVRLAKRDTTAATVVAMNTSVSQVFRVMCAVFIAPPPRQTLGTTKGVDIRRNSRHRSLQHTPVNGTARMIRPYDAACQRVTVAPARSSGRLKPAPTYYVRIAGGRECRGW